MIREPFEIKIRRLMDDACELMPKLSGAQLETAHQYHKFLMRGGLGRTRKTEGTMTGILAPPKHEKVEIEVNGSTYVLRNMSDPEIAAWSRERRAIDAAMTHLREKYESDDAISSAVATGEVEAWLKQQT